MKEWLRSRRGLNAAGFVACVGMMAYALYSQHVLGLDPCPLCIFQRIGVIVTGICFALAALHGPGQAGARVYGSLIALSALIGASISGWHVYMQNLPPDQVPECGPGLGYMLDTLPFVDTLKMVFQGSGECAETLWSFIGLSMPAWVLISFLFLALFGFANNWRRVE